MHIWVDADACPGQIKELLFRTATRREVPLTLVANQPLNTPRSDFIECLVVSSGMNMADRRIVELASSGDLVITADIPLAAAAVDQGAAALNPRGELYTEENIGARLAERNLVDTLRGGDLVSGGPAAFGPKDRQAFANQLDRWLTRALREAP
ncbi:MAG: DUF188 domain-containing protein [Planctomycetaceae bacterium]|nr:DUF188 domain-containing protein [Planctomycetaceae bacterium]